MNEGKSVVRASLQAALVVADLTAKSMTLAVTMHRSSWMQTSGLLPEVLQTLQDLPFEGSSLFSEQTDAKLQWLKDSKASLKSLRLYSPGPSRKHCRLQ